MLWLSYLRPFPVDTGYLYRLGNCDELYLGSNFCYCLGYQGLTDAFQHVKESLRDLQADVPHGADSAYTVIASSRCQNLFSDLGCYRCIRFGHVNRDWP